LLELLVLFVANRVAFGVWLPTSNVQGLWFYAALFGLLLGQRLDTPFFTTPKDAVLYAVPALVAILQIGDETWLSSPMDGAGMRLLLLGWIGITIVVSSLAIWFQSADKEAPGKISLVGTHLSGALGNPKTFFSVILVLLLVTFPPASTLGLLAIVVAWALSVPFSLLDYLYGLVRRIRTALLIGPRYVEAEVASFQVPGLIVLRAQSEHAFQQGAVVAYRAPTLEVRLASVLGHAGRDSGALTRAIDMGASQAQKSSHAGAIDTMKATNAPKELISEDHRSLADSYFSQCIGVVAPESEIGRLLVDVTTERDLSAGRLVRAKCGGSDAFYQLTNGLTKEDIVQQKNTFGFVAAHAKSVGRWDEVKSVFYPIDWVPSPNAPVWMVESTEREQVDTTQVGTFPGTDFGVGFKNAHHLVTHNTAILGILGVGKSMLALELIERALAEGCKVIALDLTDQYEDELKGLYDETYNAAVNTALHAAGGGKTNYAQNVEEGGAKAGFSQEVQKQVEAFMASDERLLILNPGAFEVWRQDSKMFNYAASMVSLTACEITQLVSEAALRAAQQRGRTDKARLWLVYEEAHSLVPEWNATVGDGDRSACNGSARAILQGRKYGLGCLLITQRTASVTKTILNQCNTIFAMRSFDDTSRDFLSNYIGKEYASLLPSLPERHAVFFGRASSCENPVHIALNDRGGFTAAFRAKPEAV
jgi:hypothetical protein